MFNRQDQELYALTLKAPAKYGGIAEILKFLCLRVGLPVTHLIELKQNQHVQICAYLKTRQRAQRICQQMKDLHLKQVRFQIQRIHAHQWKEQARLRLYPLALTESLDVVPLGWKRKYRRTSRGPIYLKNVAAFGTGQHETTQFMAHLIERLRGRVQRFLDIGTGTGILALVAPKAGAREITVIDKERQAVKAAKENFIINRVPCWRAVRADVKRWKGHRKFDLWSLIWIPIRSLNIGEGLCLLSARENI